MRGQTAGGLTGLRPFMQRLAAPLFAIGMLVSVPTASADDNMGISGTWVSDDGHAIVEIAPCGSSAKRLCGDVVWVGNEAAIKVGDTLLKSFQPVGRNADSNKWIRGRVLVNKSRRGYDGQLDREGSSLTVSYCKGNTCYKDTWTKASSQQLAAAGLQADN